jgi:hypothetical protein
MSDNYLMPSIALVSRGDPENAMLLPHDAMRLMHHVWSGRLAATIELAIERQVRSEAS